MKLLRDLRVRVSDSQVSYTPPSQNAGLFGGSGAFYDLMKVIAYSASDYTLTIITGQNAAAPYSGSFATLMSTLIANSANSVNYTLHVDNLTPGRRYRVQFISHQKVDYAGVRDMEFHHGSAAHTTLRSGAFDAFTPSTSIVHFTAATGRQSFYVRADLTDRSIINAVSVFDVTPRGTMIKVL